MEIAPSLKIIFKKKLVLSETFFLSWARLLTLASLKKKVYSLSFDKKSNVDFSPAAEIFSPK